MTRPDCRYFKALGVALLLAAAAGCVSTQTEATTELNPKSLSEVRRLASVDTAEPHRPAVALALGGGGLRGFAHLGVLRALDEAGIRPDIVVGTSAGSVVGAVFASGMPAAKLESVARAVELWSLMDFTLGAGGIVRGDELAAWVDTVTGGVPIERFPIRFAAVATDLQTGKAVAIDQGPAGVAVRASSAVPGVAMPVRYEHGQLIDGAVSSLVPVRFARAMGADFVIAVDIYCQGPRGNGQSAVSVARRAMHAQSCLLAAAEMEEADVLISPSVAAMGISAKDAQELAIQAGYEAAHTALTAPGLSELMTSVRGGKAAR